MSGKESSSACRVVFILIDGLGDVSIPQLGHNTPLQAAYTPFLDGLAAAGLNGLMDSVEPGLACGSDTAHLSIFGYEPRIYYRGRGAFESMGAGIAMDPGDIAFKCNFATINAANGIVEHRRADRHFEAIGPVLCDHLNGLKLPSFPQHAVEVKYATEHRCGIVVKGAGLTDAVSGTDPLKDNLPLQRAQPLDDSPEAAHTAAVVNELSQEIQLLLQQHPINEQRRAQGKNVANVVLLRGCGVRIDVPTFTAQHGMHACMVAPTKIIAGLGMTLGMSRLEAPGATGFYTTQFHSKARTIVDAVVSGGFEFGFLHIKAVDDTGHDRMWPMKVKFLECIDQMMGQIVAELWQAQLCGKGRFALCCTGDHSTPVIFGDHSFEPVPFSIAHVQHVVDVLGKDTVAAVRVEPIINPDVQAPHTFDKELPLQCMQLQQRKEAAKSGQTLQTLDRFPVTTPTALFGDEVMWFDEVSAARGCLGRFPGCEAMKIIKQFAGVAA